MILGYNQLDEDISSGVCGYIKSKEVHQYMMDCRGWEKGLSHKVVSSEWGLSHLSGRLMGDDGLPRSE